MSMMDNRAQSHVIGAVLIFAILLTLLGIYQVYGVPQQNKEIEFKHSQEIQSDMIDLRSSIISAAANNEPVATSISTGVRYPTRVLTLNPPPVSGTFRTMNAGEYAFTAEQNLSSVCGMTPSTKFFEYAPSYNEYSNGNIISYDNSVVNRSSEGNTLLDSGQVLVRGGQITIIPIVGDISSTKVGETSFDLIPTERTGVTKVTEEDPDDGDTFSKLVVPTRMSSETWEDNILADERFVVRVDDHPDGVEIVLEGADTPEGPDEYTIRCTPIGVNEGPDVSSLPRPGDDNPINPGGDINPTPRIQFKEASIASGPTQCDQAADCQVDVTFENKLNQDVDIVRARFVYFYEGAQGGATPGTFDPPEYAEYDGVIYEITGPDEAANNQTLPSGNESQVSVFFGQSQSSLNNDNGDYNVEGGDWFVLRMTFEDENGDRFSETYFIPPE